MIGVVFLLTAASQTACSTVADKALCSKTWAQAVSARNKLDSCLGITGEKLAQNGEPLTDKYRAFVKSCAFERGDCVLAYFDFSLAKSLNKQQVKTAQSFRDRMRNAAAWCDERYPIFGPRMLGSEDGPQI